MLDLIVMLAEFWQYDKFVFSSAAVFGMIADLDLQTPVPGTKTFSTQRYSTAYVRSYILKFVGHS